MSWVSGSHTLVTLIAATAFMLLFVLPVALVQTLTDAARLSRDSPFFRKLLEWKFMTQVVEGYLPSVILILFLYMAPSINDAVLSSGGLYFSHCKEDINLRLVVAVPSQAILFMTSGWASLSVELLQPFMLMANMFSRHMLKKQTPRKGTLSFPYHSEVPRVLLVGLIGLTCSVLAPLITPFLLAYFMLAYLVYRNQVLMDLDLED